jgi:hypothetical protein
MCFLSLNFLVKNKNLKHVLISFLGNHFLKYFWWHFFLVFKKLINWIGITYKILKFNNVILERAVAIKSF